MVELNDKREAFSGWPMIIAWIGMLVFAFHASTHMVGAGDTWVALACGRHFVNHGVDTVEPFSANSHEAGPTEEDIENWPQPAKWLAEKAGMETVQKWHPTGWVNQNWLTHVIFYWLSYESPFADAESRCFNTLVYWKFAIYVLMVAAVYYIGRVFGANGALSAAFACCAMFVGRSFFDIRPAGFSNLLTAVFILILALTTYKNYLYIWLLVPLSVFWCNVHGGYIYLFMVLAPFIVIHFVARFFGKNFIYLSKKGLYHTIGAAAATFFACLLFNPFHLTNFTHTFIVSISEHAKLWRTVNEWHPAFEWDNPVGTAIPFLIMYIFAWLFVLLWIGSMIFCRRFVKNNTKRKEKVQGDFQWPKIDLALIFVAVLTIYMAIRSRRFIPIAAAAACPFMAMFIDQTARMFSACRNFRKKRRLVVSGISGSMQKIVAVAGILAVLFFGTWWGVKFKKVYLDPWPIDYNFDSVFMRMTASYAKPFYAMEFISENNLEGNMFNYWTEGGFIAWGQNPDPNTGEVPLKVFMDGRAQAAYEPATYKKWANIMAGGPYVKVARSRNSEIPYDEVAGWLEKQMENHNVWIAMMPQNQFDTPFVKGLLKSGKWFEVFVNDKQKIFVNIETERGKKLFNGILNGSTKYPDQFHTLLNKGYILLRYINDNKAKRNGLELLRQTLDIKPTRTAMMQIVSVSNFEGLGSRIVQICSQYLDDFNDNRDEYIKESGYHDRLVVALIASNYLNRIYQQQGKNELAQQYQKMYEIYMQENSEIKEYIKW